MTRKTRIGATLLAATIPLAATAAAPPQAAAQQSQSRILAATHAICRAGPSDTTAVVARLVPRGNRDGFGHAYTPRRQALAPGGELWLRIQVRLPRDDVDCWLPESALPPSLGPMDDLLRIADGLLTAPEGRPLTEWVAAHNLFLGRWNREMVEASAILGLRRLEVLERALSAVGESGGWQPTLAEADPLVHAWIEALGDEAVYSSRRRWEVSREAFEALHAAHPTDPLADEIMRRADEAPSGVRPPTVSTSTPPAHLRPLATIVPDATCARSPSLDAETWWTLPLDHHFTSDRPDTLVAGEHWTFFPRWGCWLPASMTGPGDSDEHVAQIAERFFVAPLGRTGEYLMRVYNVLSSRRGGHADAVARSPVLGLRRLQLLDRWLVFDPWSVDPLSLALIRSLDADIRYHEPAGQWALRDDAVLRLHERHRGHPEAREILWQVASATALHDCESDLACFIRWEVLNRWARYWADYPGDPRVAEAVTRALDRLGHVLDGCRAAGAAEPGSREARWLERVGWVERGAEAVARLRATLTEVPQAAGEPLVRFLDDLEGCAAELGARPPVAADPRTGESGRDSAPARLSSRR